MKRPGEEDGKEKGDIEKRGGGQGEGKGDKSEEVVERDGDEDEEGNNQRFTRVWRKREGRRPVKVTKSHLRAERASLNKENDREEEREAEAASHPGTSPKQEWKAPPERWTPPPPPSGGGVGVGHW